MTEDEMVGWHHRLDEHGFGWTLGGGEFCFGHTEWLEVLENLLWASTEYPTWSTPIIFMTI